MQFTDRVTPLGSLVAPPQVPNSSDAAVQVYFGLASATTRIDQGDIPPLTAYGAFAGMTPAEFVGAYGVKP